jgi:hypothetical protein
MLYIILRSQLIVCLTCISIHLITPPSRSEGLIVTNTVDVFKDFLNAQIIWNSRVRKVALILVNYEYKKCLYKKYI